MNDDNSLLINIEAIDEASETIQGVSDEAQAMADSISASVLEANGSLTGMEESVTMVGDAFAGSATTIEESMGAAADSVATLNEIIATDSESISEDALAIGSSFDTAAAMTLGATTEMEADTEAASTAVGGLSTKMLGLQAAALLVFTFLKKQVTDAVGDVQTWDQSLSLIQNELKNTGSSLPIDQISAYATQIQNTTNFSDQSALSAEAQIMAHKELQGSYQDLTNLTADLATKMRGDMPAAATTLMNALEDPITGLTRLGRAAGVDFSPAMVTLIDKLAKSGDMAKAQSLIIDTLNGSIKGAAQAAADAPGSGLTQFQNSLGTLNRALGDGMVPLLDKIVEDLKPIITGFTNWAKENPTLSGGLDLVGTALAGIVASTMLLTLSLPGLKILFSGIQLIVAELAGVTLAGLVDAFIFLAGATGVGLLIAAFVLLDKYIIDHNITWTDVWNGMKTIAKDAWDWINNNVIQPMIKEIQHLIDMWNNSPLGKSVNSVAGAIGGAASSVMNFVGTHLAEGGLVTSPTIALVGEAGPEAVIPLSMLGSGSALGGGQGGGINVYITGTVQSTADQAKALGDAIAKQINRSLKLQSFR